MRTVTAILLFAAIAVTSVLTSVAPVIPLENNFNRINDMGGYHFGYNDGRVARQEERTPEGVVRGAYTYVDTDGQIQIVTYTADRHNGFVVSGTNIPKLGPIPEDGEDGEIVEETPAALVREAPKKTEHLDTVRTMVLGEASRAPVMMEKLSLPVQYTPEVAAARAEHLALYGKVVLRNSGAMSMPVAQYHSDYLPYASL